MPVVEAKAASEDSAPMPPTETGAGTAAAQYEELAFLPPPAPFYVQEGLREKLVKKTKENPFVPLGVVFTTIVLGMGLNTLRTGDSRRSQILMRLRVGGQAFAIFAMLAGVYYKTKGNKQN